MSVIAENTATGKKYLFVKGAPETIINLCVNSSKPTNFEQFNLREADKGYRILGLAYKEIEADIWEFKRENMEKNLDFLGLIVFHNPNKPESRKTIKTLKKAKIAIKMITGDNPQTGLAVARELKIVSNPKKEIVIKLSLEKPDSPIKIEVIEEQKLEETFL